ncbi:MAG TPA: exodeoxyribonuclease VII small subunit [Isosphaeraceae bacterium]|jgi:exodeoxyribonuclease VII small subunit|nr:exodeoxyribonuclease VII small subunit [Isosphaeraceae bacterium]
MSTDADAEPAGFEDALDALERTVEGLEAGDLGLDAALGEYARGVRLLARCRSLLDAAGRSVALLTGVAADGTPITAPFDDAATDGRPDAEAAST